MRRTMVAFGILLIVIPVALAAQEFGIAVGRDTCFSMGAVFCGPTGMVTILGDTISQYNVTVQPVSPPANVVGPRISIGRQAVFGGAVIAADGNNYLLVWREFTGEVNGQLVNQSGGLIGSYFNVGHNASLTRPGGVNLVYGDTAYLAIYIQSNNFLVGQRISRSGTLLGGPIAVSADSARDISLGFDGTNYLAAWVNQVSGQNKDVFGQFISRTGSLVGGNFAIDNGPRTIENGISMAYGSTRYLVIYPDVNPNTSRRDLIGRFINTSGTVEGTIMICDSTKYPNFPGVAFDGNNYATVWTQGSNMRIMGRFWTPAGAPLDSQFVVFDSVTGRIPLAGGGYGGGWYLVVCSRMDYSFTNGDVYGRFLPQTGIEEGKPGSPVDETVLRCRPDPFISFTTVPGFETVEFMIYDAAGRVVGSYPGSRIGADLAPGVYFARVADPSIPAIRLVKVR